MTEKDFLASKIPTLMKEGYNRSQASAIAYNMYNKQKKYAQLGAEYNPMFKKPTIPMEEYNGLMSEYNPMLANTNFANTMPYTDTQIPKYAPLNAEYNDYIVGDYNLDGIVDDKDKTDKFGNKINPEQTNTVYNNRTNIMNPMGGVSMDYALNFAGRGFGAKNPLQAGIGSADALLKGTRSFLSGLSEGVETKRVQDEMMRKMFEKPRNYVWAQEGMEMTNADIIAQNAIIDQGQGNINLEGNEVVMRNNGQIQPVVGEPHIKNGKIADGVNATLNNGDKVISDYVKLKPKDIKELKDRYNISVKKGATFAEAQKKLDQKLGIKKLEDEKAELVVKLETISKQKDGDTKELNTNTINKQIGTVNEKINALSGARQYNFEYLFDLQESQAKKGDGTQLFDDNGKEVTDSQGMIAQQGGKIESLAKKHNIPLERAMELLNMKMQEGGEMEQEGNQGQEQQIIQMVLQMLQGGATPEQVVQTLFRQGVPQEVVVGIIQQVAGQQNPQEEEMEGQYSNKQEEGMEMAQQGGEKMYAQEGWRDKLNKDRKYGRDAEKDYVDGAFEEPNYEYESIPKIADRFKFLASQRDVKYDDLDLTTREGVDTLASRTQQWDKTNLPNLTQDYGMNVGLTKQGIDHFIKSTVFDKLQKSNPELAKKLQGAKRGTYEVSEFNANDRDIIMSLVKESGDKTFAEKNYLDDKAFFRGIDKQKIYFDNKEDFEKYKKEKGTAIDGYYKTDKKGVYVKPILLQPKEFKTEKEKQDWIEKYGENKEGLHGDFIAEDPNADIYYTPFAKGETPTDKPQNISTDKQTQTEYKDRVKNIMPNFAPYMPYLSPLQPVAKQQVDFTRIAPIKLTPEPMLAEQERQRLTDTERVTQLGLSPQQQEAILAQGLASSQLASNDAIAKTETWNAQNQFQTDSYNAGMSDKEKLMNIQLVTDYEGKTMQSLSNQEASLNNIYREQFLQNQSDNNYVTGLNKFNTLSDQFSVTPYGVEYLNNNRPSEEMDWKFLEGMTPEQRLEWKKLEIEKAKLKNFAQQGKRYSK